MTELVHESLVLDNLPAHAVIENRIGGGRNSSLVGELRDEKELRIFGRDDVTVHHCPRDWILKVATICDLKEARVDALAQADEGDLYVRILFVGSNLQVP